MSNYDPLDTCPYEDTHRIRRSRFQYHITKCAKNWPNVSKKQCPYNARHIVNPSDLENHMNTCPQRESVFYKIVENEDIKQPKILPINPEPAVTPTEENWEVDGIDQRYDPMEHTENRLVTRILIGASKSQRKKHRLQERLRISRLQNDQREKDSATRSNNNQHVPSLMKPSIPEEVSVEAEQEYQPSRYSKKSPSDTLKISKLSVVNDSTHVTQTQNSVNQCLQEKSNIKEDQHQRCSNIESDCDVIECKKLDAKEGNNTPFLNRNKKDFNLQTIFNHANATKYVPTCQLVNSQQYNCTKSDDHVIESIKFDIEKENNLSFSNTGVDKNLVEVTDTVKALTIDDEGHKMQSQFLDRTLKPLKKSAISSVINSGLNRINVNRTTDRRSSRCAADLHFTNLKQYLYSAK